MFIYLLDVEDSNVQCPISNKERTSRRSFPHINSFHDFSEN